MMYGINFGFNFRNPLGDRDHDGIPNYMDNYNNITGQFRGIFNGFKGFFGRFGFRGHEGYRRGHEGYRRGHEGYRRGHEGHNRGHIGNHLGARPGNYGHPGVHQPVRKPQCGGSIGTHLSGAQKRHH